MKANEVLSYLETYPLTTEVYLALNNAMVKLDVDGLKPALVILDEENINATLDSSGDVILKM